MHFDGPMVNGEGVDTDSGINDMLQYLVHKATGIRIQLEEKENLTWLEFVHVAVRTAPRDRQV